MGHTFQVRQLTDAEEKASCTRQILETLPDWFGNAQALEQYCQEVRPLPFWVAVDPDGRPKGILAGDIHYGRTGEIIVMGVAPGAHRQGVGRALYEQAEAYFRQAGCVYVMVKTLSEQTDFAPYKSTRRFYQAMGFAPLVTLEEMWDAENPCLIMLKALGWNGPRETAESTD